IWSRLWSTNWVHRAIALEKASQADFSKADCNWDEGQSEQGDEIVERGINKTNASLGKEQ
ncbi:3273_t:CDS:1, partial [Acaulospora colombiana]